MIVDPALVSDLYKASQKGANSMSNTADRYELERFLNEREAARVTGYSRSSLYQFRKAGKGPPAIKTPTGSIRYSYGSLVKWLKGDKQ